jgi:muramoyltetrapeptide carboxypeptidase
MSRASSIVLPPALAPGDLVAVVAPSSPFPRQELLRGLAWLRARYRIRIARRVFARDGYLAGDDAARAAELARAMRDPEVRAIIAARGGYGAMRILGDLPWEQLATGPKWLVGFSDITALHAKAWDAGFASIHGPNVTGLGTPSVADRAAWLAALERPTAARSWKGLRVVHAGGAEGVIVGGNLAILHAMAAAGRLAIPEGAVLAIEDVTEAPYRVDRMLTSLLLGGHLERASAIVCGGFDRCPAGSDGRTVEEVLAERTAGLRVPVVAGAPFGHGSRNEAFVLGCRVRVEGGGVRFARMPEGTGHHETID